MRSLDTLLCAVCVACAGFAGCNNNSPIDLFVIHPLDANPWVGPDAATQVRLTLGEGDAGQTSTVDVAANGSFEMSLQPNQPSTPSRLHVEALRNGQVTSHGTTPLTDWQGSVGQIVSVFMQPLDSLVPGLSTLPVSGRAGGTLFSDNQHVYAFTVPNGTTADTFPTVYDLLTNTNATYPQAVPAWCDADCSVLFVGGFVLLMRGLDDPGQCVPTATGMTARPRVAEWTGSATQAPAVDIPLMPINLSPRCNVRGSTSVADTLNGGTWLLGGHVGAPAQTTPSDRIDYVGTDVMTHINEFPSPGSMQVPRDRPDAISITDATNSPMPRPGVWLVFGGQAPGAPSMEMFSPGATVVSARVTNVGDDLRVGAAIVCVQFDAFGCAAAMVLGGQINNAIVPDDYILDTTCLRQPASSCNAIPFRSPAGGWLLEPRVGARAALAEGGSLVVVGGADAHGAPRLDVEVLDVSQLALPSTTAPGGTPPPPQAHVVGTYPCANPYVVPLSNGSVMIAGGRHTDGTACPDIWFYRR